MSKVQKELQKMHPTAKIEKNEHGDWEVTYDWEFTVEQHTYTVYKGKLLLVATLEWEV